MKNFIYPVTFGLLILVSCEPRKQKPEASVAPIDSLGVPTAINKDSSSGSIFIKYAHTYNNFIIERQGYILEDHIAFVKAVHKNDSVKIVDERYKTLVNQTKMSVDTLEKLGSFNGNSEFKTAGIELFKFYQEAWGDYLPLLEVKNEKERTKILENIKLKFNDIHAIKEKRLEEAFSKAHTNFVNEYKLHVRSSSLHETLDSLQIK